MSHIIEAMTILYRWQASQEEVKSLMLSHEHATAQRQAHFIIDIDRSLNILFTNPLNINGFMQMPNSNAPFLGQSPMEVVTDDPKRLEEVAKHIRGLSQPW